MRSFILKTRLEILSSNLRDVKGVIELAKRRGQEIQSVKDRLFGHDGVRELANELRTAVNITLQLLDDDDLKEQRRVTRALDTLEDASDQLSKLTEHLEACHKALDALLGSRVELSTRRIQERLPDKAEASIREVQSLLDESTAVTSAWEVEERLAAQSEPLFAEYVDLLRGLALRESGIECGICELADRLLDGCDRVVGAPWRSLAIPSYRGPRELTPAQIIRLGFPEWTIWALPLAAYEFGRLMVNQDATLDAKVKEEVNTRHASGMTLIDSLADAFATYAVGPAYACAAVLMRLNPRPIAPGGPAIDDTRARIIFEMLKMADDSAGLGVSFATVRTRLKDAWAEALNEARATPSAGAGPEELAAFFWKWAERNYVTAKYQPQAWQIAERLKDVLSKRATQTTLTTEDEAAMTAGAGDVRDVLNAAWFCRVEGSEKTDEIAREALAVWQEKNVRQQKVTRFASHRTAQPGVQRRTS